MKAPLFALVLAAVACQTALAQDTPITATTTTITILTTPYSGSGGPCSVFAAESIMSDITQTLNIGSQGSGAGAGKVTFNPFTIAKQVDSCSATLFVHAASGTAFKELIAVVESRPSVNGAPGLPTGQTFMIRLGLAAVATLDDTASDGAKLLEKVTLDFGDLTIAQFDAVSGRMASCTGWDRVRNVQDGSNCGELETIALNRARGKTR